MSIALRYGSRLCYNASGQYLREGKKKATYNEKLMTSPGLAVMEVGSKVLPLAPTAIVCVAARTREAARRAITVRTSILQGRGREREVGSRKEGKIGAIVYKVGVSQRAPAQPHPASLYQILEADFFFFVSVASIVCH
jgi:hypothetical protein